MMAIKPSGQVILLCLVLTFAIVMCQSVTFDTNFVELDTSKMIHTSDWNYAICSHNFPSNWRSVSVNGDELTVVTQENLSLVKKMASLTPEERNSLNSIKAQLVEMIRVGPYNVKSSNLSRLTTFDRYGSTSTAGLGGEGGSSSSSSSSSSSAGSGGMSVSRTGPNSYIITKQAFPFNWHRVFVNDDVNTVVYRNGRVIMLPQVTWNAEEKAELANLRAEVDKSSKAAEEMTREMTKSLSNPMDFVNRAFGGMFGR